MVPSKGPKGDIGFHLEAIVNYNGSILGLDVGVFLWALVLRHFDSGGICPMASFWYMVHTWHVLEQMRAHILRAHRT